MKGLVSMALYASGDWHVKADLDQEFVEKWTEFLRWTQDTFPAKVTATLMRDQQNSGHYVSFSEWSDEASREAWRQDSGFQEHFGAAAALCESMTSSYYETAASV